MSGFLSKKEREDLLYELSLEKNLKYAKRIMTILHLDKGKLCKDISRFLFIDEGTIRACRDRYNKGGIECLINDNYSSKRSFLTKERGENAL